MTAKIDTPSARARLEPARNPYFHKIGVGKFVGYRRTGDGGTWIARFRDPNGKQLHRALGRLDDIDPKEQFEQAQKQARDWFKQCQAGAVARYTVGDALDDYLDDLKVRKGASARKTAENRIDAQIRPKFGDTLIDRLTYDQIYRWQRSLVDGADDKARASKATANRTLSVLKAALNLAFKRGKVATDNAWRRVSPFAGVNEARTLFLTQEQVGELLAHSSGALNTLIKAHLLTGLRPGALTDRLVEHLDRKHGRIQIDHKVGRFTHTLSRAALAHFKAAAKGKTPKALLFPRDDGKAWYKEAWRDELSEVIKAAKLPSETALYSLRHYYISRAVNQGVNIELLGPNVGTSPAMIRKFYHKFLPDTVRDQLDVVQL